jgi:hypothetical protein
VIDGDLIDSKSDTALYASDISAIFTGSNGIQGITNEPALKKWFRGKQLAIC